MRFLVGYSETFTGTVAVEASSEKEANDKVLEMIDRNELTPSTSHAEHEVTVNYVTEGGKW